LFGCAKKLTNENCNIFDSKQIRPVCVKFVGSFIKRRCDLDQAPGMVF